jgi:hypothetical protein
MESYEIWEWVSNNIQVILLAFILIELREINKREIKK